MELDFGLDSDFNFFFEFLVDDDVVIVDVVGFFSDDWGFLCFLQRDLYGFGVLEWVEWLKQDLLDKVWWLGWELLVNILDEFIDQLGGFQWVVEMIGRKGCVVFRFDGMVVFELWVEQGLFIDYVNFREKQCFMSGEKFVVIILEVFSLGVFF